LFIVIIPRKHGWLKRVRKRRREVEFFRDMAGLNLGQHTAASFSTCRVTKRPLIVTDLEYHTHCGEGILPLDGDILQPVAPATANGDLSWDRIEVFRIPKGTIVTLNAGVWHCGPYAYQSEVANVLIVLPERVPMIAKW
jgi:ureidoglycolate lyase